MSRQALALAVAVLLGTCVFLTPPAPSQAQDEGVGPISLRLPNSAAVYRSIPATSRRNDPIEQASPPSSLTHAQAVEIICAYDWSCEDAVSVAWRESRLEPDAYNPGCRCVGWFQIAGVHGYRVDELSDPHFNTRVAYELWLASGWRPWRQ